MRTVITITPRIVRSLITDDTTHRRTVVTTEIKAISLNILLLFTPG
jgi:hypothetical protein